MKREDKVNIEITLQEAAWLYALTSQSNGVHTLNLFKTFMMLVDPEGKAYDKHIRDNLKLVNYIHVQKEFESAIFDRKTPEQLQLAEVMSKISDLQAEAAKLQELIK